VNASNASTLYAESSAILNLLLGEPGSDQVAEALASAGRVVVSELTLAETHRTLLRARAAGKLNDEELDQARGELEHAGLGWSLQRLDAETYLRLRRPFPVEPIRTLDALHLAGALAARREIPEIRLLSLDRRLRENALELGFVVEPEAAIEAG
jgi:predicted nucleic acid-binding protein